jgi:hypothetical protein
MIFLFVILLIARKTDICHCVQPLVEMGSAEHFAQAGLKL